MGFESLDWEKSSMNPLSIVGMAVVGLLAVLLFVSFSGELRENREESKAKMELESVQFDKDFAGAWNGGEVSKPDASAVDQAKAKLVAVQASAAERRKKSQETEKELEAELKKMAE